jgi:hypothetical protein
MKSLHPPLPLHLATLLVSLPLLDRWAAASLLRPYLHCCSRSVLERQVLEQKLPNGVLLSLSAPPDSYAESMESLMRLREPAAWVALGALVVNLVIAIVGLATFEGPLVSMAWMWSERVADPMPLVALAVLVSLCVLFERTPHARQLTLVSLIASVIAVLLGLTLALLGIVATAPILAVLAAIVPQAISVIAVALLIKLLQLQAVPRRLPPGIGVVSESSEALAAPTAPDQQVQPTWQPDTAAGAVWHTAVEATAGTPPPTGWRTEAPTVRWETIVTPTNGSGPDGGLSGDPDRQVTVPMLQEQPPGLPENPRANQEQRNSQPLALDWSGSPKA